MAHDPHNLYSLHTNSNELDGYCDNMEFVVPALAAGYLDEHQNIPHDILKKLERAISKNALCSFWYARYYLKGRFELGEPMMAKFKDSYRYAQYRKALIERDDPEYTATYLED